MLAYALSFIVSITFLIIVAVLVHQRRTALNEMGGMMAGMAFGMFGGLVTATMYLIPTGDFLWGTISGSVVGLAFGFVMGLLGGPMGIMEGVMAGPMGGMMGAMLGQMIRPFALDQFMLFFFALQAVSVAALLYCLPCGKCDGGHQPLLPTKHILSLLLLFVGVAGLLFMQTNYSLAQPTAYTVAEKGLQLPANLRALTQETRANAVLAGDVQKITMKITGAGYSPNYIVAKKGTLIITLEADETAGCTRDIVFPDFGIRKLVPENGRETVRLELKKTGEYRFHCSMDMMKGKIIVEG
ncbi:cupredoxin domain-containing protein [Candidatus Woesearchaeota archaeon]|nr:cupredoxin domain-containing protein [Candidatus Woesearchaeota archaeon]